MLTGRESLTRLVGKRRRSLDREAILDRLSNHPQGFGKNMERAVFGERSDVDGEVGKEWVECPVCGISIRENHYMINSHLDSCLTRGKKRKLTQKTLLQLNFSSERIRQKLPKALVNMHESSIGFGKDCIGNVSEPLVCPSNNDEGASWVLPHNKTEDNDCNGKCNLNSSTSLSDNSMNEPNHSDFVESISTAVLETFIVGLKFQNGSNVSLGGNVYVLRDCENAKDQNALKVVCSDSGCEVLVGYLPRDLAKYLSPLVDKCRLRLEGSVTYDTDSPGIVPLRIFCREIGAHDWLDNSDILYCKRLWEDVLRVVDCGKKYPPSMTRYQRNFHILVQEVLNCHSHILDDHEKSFLGSFCSLSDDSQRIFIRLYTRKGPWFRTSKLSYPEVGDSHKAIEDLHLTGFICTFITDVSPSTSDVAEILEVFTVPELREISCMVISKKCTNGARKDQIIGQLLATYEEGKCPLLPNTILEHAGTCAKISSTAELILWRIQRLFFLNGEQDLSSFLLADLGLVKYPTYTCKVSRPIFQDRVELLAYEEAVAVAQLMEEFIDDDNIGKAMSCTYFSYDQLLRVPYPLSSLYSQFSPSWVYSKVVTLGISICERDRRYEDAVKILKGILGKITWGGKRGYWYLRLSVDLEHMGHINESLSVAEEGALDPWVRAGSKIALQRRVLRLGKPPRRWKIPSFAASISKKIKEVHIQGRPLNCETGAKNFYYGYDGTRCNVEQLALQYYADEGGGWKGVHSESGIWLTIFGLLMWDIIFSEMPDVFQTRFQNSPLDLDTDSFYWSRQDHIESHLQKIRDGMAEEILISSWESHLGTACRGVNWDRHCLTDLRAAVSCIGGHCLASLLQQLAQDYRSWSSGMPDLFLWRFHGGDIDGGEAKLVEVKGPRDRLSEQQRAWISFLMDCGFEIEVCRVSESSPDS